MDKVLTALLAMQRYPWEQGFTAQAALETGEKEWMLALARESVFRALPDGRLAMQGSSSAVADSACAGEAVWRAWEETGDPRFRDGAMKMYDYLKTAAPRTDAGIICHFDTKPRRLWVDAVYMFPPFLAVMGDIDEAVRQIDGYADQLLDPQTGLFFHQYDADARCLTRPLHWATGNGWALMGLVRVAREAEKQGHPAAGWLYDRADALMNAMKPCLTEDGAFHYIIDDETTFLDRTSALMWAWAVYHRGAESLCDTADRILREAEAHIDVYGILHEVCGAPRFDQSGTSAEAQAAYLIAKAAQTKQKNGR